MTEQIINVGRVEHIINLFGSFDENIKLLEKEYGVSIVFRDTELKICGEPEAVISAKAAVEALLQLAVRGEQIGPQNVNYVISLVRDGQEDKIAQMGKDVICVTIRGRQVKAKTVGQQKYVDAIQKNIVTLGIGPAGTGKTYLAVACAVAAFREKTVNRIILTRPAVEAGEKLGFLPGDLQNKVDPYLRPLYDALFDMLGPEAYQRYLERGNIEVAPLAYMRGRTLDDAFIILDEAQNTTPEQMKMFLTRIGFGSRAVITGDVTQVDLPDGKRSGLKEAVQVVQGLQDIAVCTLDHKDVVRHELVSRIIKAYEKYDEQKQKNGPKTRKRGNIMSKLKVELLGEAAGGAAKLIRLAAKAAFSAFDYGFDGQVTVTVTDDEGIRAYNRDYRQVDRSTDVLSFPLNDFYRGEPREPLEELLDPVTGLVPLGDMILSLEHARAQAAEYGHGLARECAYLTVHSMLHLLGYDHVDEGEEKAAMRAKEEEILARLSLTRQTAEQAEKGTEA